MRKLLFQSLFRPPFTEQAPSPDDAAVSELASAVGDAARRRLGRSLSIREVDAGMDASSRFTRSTTPTTTSNASASGSWPRRATPMS